MTSRQLAAKENTLFRSIVKCYELKQYKKGLKAADAILKKHPDHGETLAMKGLTLNCMGKKDEAYDYVRRGLRNDLKSHVCWHVFGLLYRSDRNYTEAVKCYRNAIKIDPENLQILRDLYLLQVQIRDLKGFAETRRTMLTLKPNNRNNWIGFAISHHLIGNYQMAIDILEKYFSTIDQGVKNYEDSEIYMYQNQIIEESGDLSKALKHLDECKDMVLDTLKWRQKKAELYLKTQQYDAAKSLYEELLDINFDNYEYHRGMQCVIMGRFDLFNSNRKELPASLVNFTTETNGENMQTALLQYYNEMHEKMEDKLNSVTSLRLPLDFTTGDIFKSNADALFTRQLKKGVPSLGSSIKNLYADDEKIAIIESLITKYMTEFKDDAKTLLWTTYFAVQHYDRIGNYELALEYVDKCIKESPKTIDFVQRKARILKHMGDLQKAADVMVEARLLDLADRYINNKAAEYLLHADRITDAASTVALFTRHEGDPQQNLYDMQCMWYEIECGQSHMRRKEYGLALKRFFAVEKHFEDFLEDQFDFHTYCIRKMTLRAYLQVLRMCDTIYGHSFFVKAAHGAVSTYLTLSDAQKTHENGAGNEKDVSKMSAAEKKRWKREQAKARKAEYLKKTMEEEKAKQQKEAEEKEREAQKNAATEKKKNNSSSRKEVPKDKDPLGEELVKKPALDEAWRFVKLLQAYAPNQLETHLASFDIAIRKNKMLLCLQALLRGYKCIAECNNANVATKEKLQVRKQTFLTSMKNVSDKVIQEIVNDKVVELEC